MAIARSGGGKTKYSIRGKIAIQQMQSNRSEIIKLSLPIEKYGVLLVNLGTPEDPTPAAVRAYLKQFLSDPRVIDYPRWLWAIILNVIILPIRSQKVAKLYQQIWLPDGSPLRVYSYQQRDAVIAELKQQGLPIAVEMAMSYGTPSLQTGIDNLIKRGAERFVVLPLYPQYSATTTAAVFDGINDVLRKVRDIPELRFIKRYANSASYITALANSIKRYREQNPEPSQLLLFSFHGLPKRYVTLGDPYQKECQQTAIDVAKALGLTEQQYQVSYQSRVGKEEWLSPYTDATLKQLPSQGFTHIDVVCPAFAADCLETLEEITVENKAVYFDAGGKGYRYIPALNSDPAHIALFCDLIKEQLVGW